MKRKTPLRPSSKGFSKRRPKGTPTLAKLLKAGLVQKASSFNAKPKPMRKRAKKKPGALSQVEFFLSIWNNRRHVSQISGEDLVPPPDDPEDKAQFRAWISQFSHILPKGTYKKMKDDPRNIVLKTGQEHELWETKKRSLKELPEWQWVFRLEEELKKEANGA